MVTLARNELFAPVQIGVITLKYRVVIPPLCRLRAEWRAMPATTPTIPKYQADEAGEASLV